jgi:hypothetical protein
MSTKDRRLWLAYLALQAHKFLFIIDTNGYQPVNSRRKYERLFQFEA